MVALHAAFLAACPLEVWLLRRPFPGLLGPIMAMLLVAATLLRYWAIATLGERWTTRVICLRGAPPETGGPYRWMRHPNYSAVVVEMAALPLLHGAWLTAVFFSGANLLLLRRRIAVEEEALRRYGSPGPVRSEASR
jgi:methyltransferase